MRRRATLSTMLVCLGALLMAVAWLGYPYPQVRGGEEGVVAWPWEVIGATVDGGRPAAGVGATPVVVALGGAVLLVLLLLAALLPSGPRRGAFLFIVAGLGAIVFSDDLERLGDAAAAALPVAGALTAGAILLRDGHGAGRGRRALVFGPTLLLAGLLFFPSLGARAYARYDAVALDLLGPFLAVAEGELPLGLERLGSGDGLHAMGLGLLLLLGLASFFGVRGRWALRAVFLLVLLTALLPIATGAPIAKPGTTDLLDALATPAWSALLGLALILVAALLSLAGLGRHARTMLAGIGLGVLTLVVASCAQAEALAERPDATSLRDGLTGAALWLGPALGALLAPLAAGVLDQGG